MSSAVCSVKQNVVIILIIRSLFYYFLHWLSLN